MAVHNFADWRLRVGGLVENPVTLDLAAAALGDPETQRTMHNCVQGGPASANGAVCTSARWSNLFGRYRRPNTSAP